MQNDMSFGKERVYEEFIEFVMNDVSDEKIEDLFAEMGIKIDLNKPLENEHDEYITSLL